MTNTVGLYYMKTMGSQTNSHLLGLGTQTYCIKIFNLFPSSCHIFMKHKLCHIDGSHGSSQAASRQDSQGCWVMQLLHWLCGHSVNTLLWVNKGDFLRILDPVF